MGAERIRAGNGSVYKITAESAAPLSRSTTKKGQLQRAALALLLEHRDDDALPTSGRFLFYELEQRGVVSKTEINPKTGKKYVRADADLTKALTHLRKAGIIPWEWLFDEARQLTEWSYASSVAEYLEDRLREARIDCWEGDEAPLILCESRATAGVLRSLTGEYLCPISGTVGMVGGFLHTDIAPLLAGNDRLVLYLGDHDHQGDQIEANTKRVLERAARREIDWQRLGITSEQIEEHALEPILKKDGREKNAQEREAWEVEALGQRAVVDLVRGALDDLLPEPLEDVLERERAQREAAEDLLARLWDEG